MELFDYLPSGWTLQTTQTGLMLLAPDGEQAQDFLTGAASYLHNTAQNIQSIIEIWAVRRLGTTCKAGRGRNLRPLHNHGWLLELLQALQQQGQVRVRYQAWLNAQDEIYGELTTLFKVGTFQGEPVRIATNLDLNIIQFPTMKLVRV